MKIENDLSFGVIQFTQYFYVHDEITTTIPMWIPYLAGN
jgi:hypothetical protein